MSNYLKLLTALVMIGAAAVGGYILGQRHTGTSGTTSENITQNSAQAVKPGEKRVLYYRNPMGLHDTSLVPKKDAMGMDYTPVYADDSVDDSNNNGIKISADRIQKLGVQTAAATRQPLVQPVRITGVIQADERRLTMIALKFGGWIEKLAVAATGQTVRTGETLMRVYSPEIVQTEREYLASHALAQNGGEQATDLASAARQRLLSQGVPAGEIARLEREGAAAHSFAIPSPVNAVVLEKMAVQGQYFNAGDALFRLSDLSNVWVIGAVPEQDMANVAIGQSMTATLAAAPGRVWHGKVGFIYPDIDPVTRTGRVRIDVPNHDGFLKTGLYVAVALATGEDQPVLTVPTSAVLDDGARQAVLVDHGNGHFEPREIKVGRRGDNDIQVLSGLKEGEKVVISANFLIDAESNLQAAMRGFENKQPSNAAGAHGGHK